MKYLKVVCSNTAPGVKDALWLKPIDGGFALYALNGGWKPVKAESVEEPVDNSEEIAQSLIGSVQDKKAANTINGAKAYADDAVSALKGKSNDASTKLTLNGLKKYIDEQIEALG